MENILLLLIFLPIASGVLLMFFRSQIAKYSALGISIVELVTSVTVFLLFRNNINEHFILEIPWIQEWGINLEFGIDGINVLLMLLTGITVPIIILAGWDKSYHNYGLMDGMVLILQGSLMGVYLSFNAFVYYIFWEMTLIPAYLILLLWGGVYRMRITLKFFIYTLAGSLFMLVAFIILYLQTPGDHSFSLQALGQLSLDKNQQIWLFLAFMAAFMIKTPVFPFHSWQPDTYNQAPSAGTMLLSGLMSKMGIFSMLRWLFPILPFAVKEFSQYIIWLSLISILYASVIAFRQKNLKTLFAYSSIAHLSMVVLAIFTLHEIAIQGALLLLFSHGITIIALFFVADIFKTRIDSQSIEDMGGFRAKAPVFAALYLVVLLGSIGLPFTSGFPGEFLMISGIVHYNLWIAALAGLSIIFGAVYMLSSYKAAMLGELKGGSSFKELIFRERFVFAVLLALILFIGLFPGYFLGATEESAKALVDLFNF